MNGGSGVRPPRGAYAPFLLCATEDGVYKQIRVRSSHFSQWEESEHRKEEEREKMFPVRK